MLGNLKTQLARVLNRPGGIPWFMIPIPDTNSVTNSLLNLSSGIIFTKTYPREVSDTINLNYNAVQIPGGRADIYRFGSISARKVSFSLDLVNFNSTLGVTDELAQFALLRKPTMDIVAGGNKAWDNVKSIFQESITKASMQSVSGSLFKPFTSNPSVIYWHGVSSISPLLYRVIKCDFSLAYLNEYGRPQKASITIELVEDVSSPLSTAENMMTFALGVYKNLRNIKSLTSRRTDVHPFREREGLF